MPRAPRRKYLWPLILLGSVALIAAFAIGFLVHDAAVSTTVGLGNDLSPLKPSTSQRVVDNAKVARTIWGDVCGGDVAVTIAPLSGDRAGLSTWSTSSISNIYMDCAVIVSSAQHWSDTVLCQIVVHEYGHLAGMGHSENPRSIMYPRISKQNIPARCP